MLQKGHGSKKTKLRATPVSTTSVLRSPSIRPNEQRILVTGACESVGSFVVAELLKKGYQVVAVDSNVPSDPQFKGNVTVSTGNFSDPVFVSSLVDGIHAIIHTKSLADTTLPYAHLAPLNVEAVKILFERAKDAGVTHFIHISSASIYRSSQRPLKEDAPIEATNDYEKTKVDAERLLLSKAKLVRPYVTILRPSLVYGPRSTHFIASLATLPPLVRSFGPYYLKMKGGPVINMVHAEDVARAAVFLLNAPASYGETFNIADNDPRPFTEFINIAMEAYGLRPLGPGIPYPPTTLITSLLPYVSENELLAPLNKMNTLLWRRLVKKHRLQEILSPRFEKESIALALQPLVLDTHKLRSLGFQFKYPRFSKGWKHTITWYEEQRWIPRVARTKSRSRS